MTFSSQVKFCECNEYPLTTFLQAKQKVELVGLMKYYSDTGTVDKLLSYKLVFVRFLKLIQANLFLKKTYNLELFSQKCANPREVELDGKTDSLNRYCMRGFPRYFPLKWVCLFPTLYAVQFFSRC